MSFEIDKAVLQMRTAARIPGGRAAASAAESRA